MTAKWTKIGIKQELNYPKDNFSAPKKYAKDIAIPMWEVANRPGRHDSYAVVGGAVASVSGGNAKAGAAGAAASVGKAASSTERVGLEGVEVATN